MIFTALGALGSQLHLSFIVRLFPICCDSITGSLELDRLRVGFSFP